MLTTKSNFQHAVAIPCDRRRLLGSLHIPNCAQGIVVFAHGSGSSRLSPRNQFVAQSWPGRPCHIANRSPGRSRSRRSVQSVRRSSFGSATGCSSQLDYATGKALRRKAWLFWRKHRSGGSFSRSGIPSWICRCHRLARRSAGFGRGVSAIGPCADVVDRRRQRRCGVGPEQAGGRTTCLRPQSGDRPGRHSFVRRGRRFGESGCIRRRLVQ